ncbi:MAG TPA: YjbQ family protein [Acidimicrobiia bacterium]|nr:YjbQ family protein [Acidimicrobiia bacterium]
MRSAEIEVATGHVPTVLDLGGHIDAFLRPGDAGLLNVFAPHATCGLAVIETGAGSDSDLLASIDHLLEADDRWQHRHGSPGHGRDHVLPAWISPSVTVPVVGGRMALGTWQSVVLVDTNVDNPTRRVRLSLLG